MIQLFDRIVLNRDLPDRSLKQGDVGTVVMIYKNGKGYEVEFFTLDGATYAVETLPVSHIRAVKKNEVTHVRELI
jgi:hypothetical protein